MKNIYETAKKFARNLAVSALLISPMFCEPSCAYTNARLEASYSQTNQICSAPANLEKLIR